MSRRWSSSSRGMPTVSTTCPSASCCRNLRVPSAAVTSLKVFERPLRAPSPASCARHAVGTCAHALRAPYAMLVTPRCLWCLLPVLQRTG